MVQLAVERVSMGARSRLQTPLLISVMYLPLEASPILIATFLGSPTSSPNKMVDGSSNSSSNGDWLLVFQGAAHCPKRIRNAESMKEGLRRRLILEAHAAQVTIKDAGIDSVYKQF